MAEQKEPSKTEQKLGYRRRNTAIAEAYNVGGTLWEIDLGDF